MANEKAVLYKEENSEERLDFDALEAQLQEQLDEELSDLSFLQEQSSKVGSPEALGSVVLDTVWEQFANQIAVQAGEDFIKANKDAKANAPMTKNGQISFGSRNANLNEKDSGLKGYMSMSDWLDSLNAKGQKSDDINVEDEQKWREKDAEARAEYEKQKEEAEKQSLETGKKFQNKEAFRIGEEAAKAAVMNLLSDLVNKIAKKLVAWLISSEKDLETLLLYIKDTVSDFIVDLKNHVVIVADTAITVIATSIFGPIIGTLKKAWMFIKQGWASLKQSIDYIRKPENRSKPIGILMLEVGKIITAGLTAVGAIVLGEAIEKGLTIIPLFAVEIPFFGSLANIIGTFMGAVVSGIIGALAIYLINRLIEKRQRAEYDREKVDKGNEILATQNVLINLNEQKLDSIKSGTAGGIKERHIKASTKMKNSLKTIVNNNEENNDMEFMNINERLNELQGLEEQYEY